MTNHYWLLLDNDQQQQSGRVMAAQDMNDLFMHSRLCAPLDRLLLVPALIDCDRSLTECSIKDTLLDEDGALHFADFCTEEQINLALTSVRLHDDNLHYIPAAIRQHREFQFSLGKIKPHLMIKTK